jgi:hypothetical protein
LDNNNIQDVGVIAIAIALRYHPSLSILDLSRNNIGDVGFIALSDILQSNKSLERLCLNDNYNVTEIGLMSLANSIKYNTSLEDLCIESHSTITTICSSNSTIAFLEALQYNTKIYCLEIRNNDDWVEIQSIEERKLVREKITETLQYNDTVVHIYTNPNPSSNQDSLLDENYSRSRIAPKKGGRIRSDSYNWLINTWIYYNTLQSRCSENQARNDASAKRRKISNDRAG